MVLVPSICSRREDLHIIFDLALIEDTGESLPVLAVELGHVVFGCLNEKLIRHAGQILNPRFDFVFKLSKWELRWETDVKASLVLDENERAQYEGYLLPLRKAQR